MTTFEVEFEFWEKEEVSRTQIRRVWWLRNHWNTLFWSKIHSRRWQCDGELCRYVASKCPHAQFKGQNFVGGLAIQIQHTTDHSDCQTSIRSHEILHFGHIFVRFDVQTLPITRLVFDILKAIQKWFMPPKILCPWYSKLSISPFQFFVSFCRVYIKFDTKFDAPFLAKNLFTRMAVWQGALSWCSIQVSACPVRRSKFCGRFSDSNSTHYWSFWLSNIHQTSRDPSLWAHFRPFLTCKLFQERDSSSTFSRPSKNALCHLKAYVLHTACSP